MSKKSKPFPDEFYGEDPIQWGSPLLEAKNMDVDARIKKHRFTIHRMFAAAYVLITFIVVCVIVGKINALPEGDPFEHIVAGGFLSWLALITLAALLHAYNLFDSHVAVLTETE